jgi:hypothetical protein
VAALINRRGNIQNEHHRFHVTASSALLLFGPYLFQKESSLRGVDFCERGLPAANCFSTSEALRRKMAKEEVYF